MSKPIVAVVGRPNVGKSTLFNKLVGERIAIVEDTPGVTRDRIIADAEWRNHKFTLIDTGGIEPFSKDTILSQMRTQAEIALDMADCILFMVDGREGITATDEEVATMIRKHDKPIIVVVNKLDTAKMDDNLYEFYNLGLGDPLPISAEQQLGLGDLLDQVLDNIESLYNIDDENDNDLKVAVVGKPNAGKSTLINRLIGENRLIVSDIPGTTRDAIDTTIIHDDQEYTFIDTAGIRKKNKVYRNIEKYSIIRAVTAVDRADVVILLIDATLGVSDQDKKIASIIENRYKPCIIAINKWDLVEKETMTMKKMTDEIRYSLAFLDYAPVIFLSALTGRRVNSIYKEINFVYDQAHKRIPTGKINEAIMEMVAMKHPPGKGSKQLKIYYGSQVSVDPPTFVLFVNDPEIMHFSYLRYIENSLRKRFNFDGTPIRILLRERKKTDR